MKYDIHSIFSASSCRIVFTDDAVTAGKIEQAVLGSDPAYSYEINEVFQTEKKVGFFTIKNKKPVWEILDQTKAVQKNGGAFRELQLERLEMKCFADRFPIALTYLQKECASILYDAMNGRQKFLINDYRYPQYKSNGCTVAAWMKKYEEFERGGCELIWITCMNQGDVIDVLDENGAKAPFYSYFRVVGDEIVKYNDRELIKLMSPKKKYLKGQQCEYRYSIGEESAAQEAFDWYKLAAEDGDMLSQNALAFFYSTTFYPCEKDDEKALYWYARAAFNKEYREDMADADMKKAHKEIQNNLRNLMRRMENGEELLRSYVGAEAESFIRGAEQKQTKTKEEQMEEAFQKMKAKMNQKYFNDSMDRFLKRSGLR